MAGDPSAGGRRRAGAIGERTHCGEHVGAGGIVELTQMLTHPRTSFHALGAGQSSVPEFSLDLLQRDRLARSSPAASASAASSASTIDCGTIAAIRPPRSVMWMTWPTAAWRAGAAIARLSWTGSSPQHASRARVSWQPGCRPQHARAGLRSSAGDVPWLAPRRHGVNNAALPAREPGWVSRLASDQALIHGPDR